MTLTKRATTAQDQWKDKDCQSRFRTLTFQRLEPRSMLDGVELEIVFLPSEQRVVVDNLAQAKSILAGYERVGATLSINPSPPSRQIDLRSNRELSLIRFGQPAVVTSSIRVYVQLAPQTLNRSPLFSLEIPPSTPAPSISHVPPAASTTYAPAVSPKSVTLNEASVDQFLTNLARPIDSLAVSHGRVVSPVQFDGYIEPVPNAASDVISGNLESDRIAVGQSSPLESKEVPPSIADARHNNDILMGMIELAVEPDLGTSIDPWLASQAQEDKSRIAKPVTAPYHIEQHGPIAQLSRSSITVANAGLPLPEGMLELRAEPTASQMKPVMLAAVDPLALIQMFIRAGESTQSLAETLVDEPAIPGPVAAAGYWSTWLRDPRVSLVMSFVLSFVALATGRRMRAAEVQIIRNAGRQAG